jgi:transcriptional regulator with XRE-family HTH domain
MRPTTTGYPLQSPAQLGVYLRALRRARRLTQRDLGRRVGVSGARISEIEKSPESVGLTQVLNLLHVLGARLILEYSDKRPGTPRKRSLPQGEW